MNPTPFASHAVKRGAKLALITLPNTLVTPGAVFNPSIAVVNGQLKAAVRHCQSVLYRSSIAVPNYDHWRIVKPDGSQQIVSQTFLINLDQDLRVMQTIKCNLQDNNHCESYVGMEDARLIEWNQQLYLVGTVWRNGVGQIDQVHINNLGQELGRQTISHNTQGVEKNWMPVLDQPYHYVKWSCPLSLVNSQGSAPIVDASQPQILPRELRGGSQVVCVDQHQLAFVHSSWHDRGLNYSQSIICWDKNWQLRYVSTPFTMLGSPVEFVSGLAIWDGWVYVGFGVRDSLPFVLKMSMELFMDMCDGSFG